MKAHCPFVPRDVCPHPAEREWDGEIPPQQEHEEQWWVAWPKGLSTVDLDRIYFIFKVFKRGWWQKDLQWPPSLPFWDHPSLLSSGGWQMLLLLVWLPRAWEFHRGSLDEGWEACCLAVIWLFFFQWLFLIDSHKAVNNWPSLFL